MLMVDNALPRWILQPLVDELLADIQQCQARLEQVELDAAAQTALIAGLKQLGDVAKTCHFAPLRLVLFEMLAVLLQAQQQHPAALPSATSAVLARALLVVERALERQRHTLAVNALGFLSTLNDLRALRGQPMYSEAALLLPDFSLPDSTQVIEVGGKLQQQAQKLTQSFHAQLRQYKADGSAQATESLCRSLSQLQRQAELPETRVVWLIARSFVEVLAGDDYRQPAIANQLSWLGYWVEQVAKHGESALRALAEIPKLKSLLYYVARSANGSPVVELVKKKFKLQRYGQLDPASRLAEIYSTDSLLAIAETLRDEVQDMLSFIDRLSLRGARSSQLYPVTVVLQRIGDCLAVLGAEPAQAQHQRSQAALQRLLEHDQPLRLGELEALGAELLKLDQLCESAINDQLHASTDLASHADRTADHPLYALPKAEQASVFAAVSQQLTRALSLFRDQALAVAEQRAVAADVQAVAQVLDESAQVLSVMSLPLAASAMSWLSQLLPRELEALGAGESWHEQGLRPVADAVAALELYSKEMQRGDPLSYRYLERVNDARDTYALWLRKRSGSPSGPSRLLTEARELSQTLSQTAETEALLCTSEVDSTQSFTVLPDDVDPELLSVFVAEALEQFSDIATLLPKLRHQRAHTESLQRLRRCYHTLKGSGRLVGAELLGEFCWTQESLLNHVIERAEPLSDRSLGLLEQGVAVLPQLIEQLGGTAEQVEGVDELMQQARAVFSAPAIEPEQGVLINDPELCEVFCHESAEHLTGLDVLLRHNPRGSALPVDELLFKHCHTLHGSASTAGIESVAQLTEPLLGLVRWHVDHSEELDQADFQLVSQALRVLKAAVDKVALGLDDVQLTGQMSLRLRERLSALVASPRGGSQAKVEGLSPLQQIFISESEELVEQAQLAFEAWSDHTEANSAHEVSLRRVLHTFKGSALMADQRALADLTHAMESALDEWTTRGDGRNPSFLKIFQECLDALSHNLEILRQGEVITRFDWLIQALSDGAKNALTEPQPERSTTDAVSSALALPGAFDSDNETEADRTWIEQTLTVPVGESALLQTRSSELTSQTSWPSAIAERPSDDEGTSQNSVKVNSDTLDKLVRFAAENNVFRVRAMQKCAESENVVEELQQTVRRLREQLRQLDQEAELMIRSGFRDGDHPGVYASRSAVGFDPLELDRYSTMHEISRSTQESLTDLDNLGELVQRFNRDLNALLGEQASSGGGLQDGLMRLRMQRFDTLKTRLERVVRQAAQQLGKQVSLSMQGEGLELDRSVLARLAPSLEHLLRNAVTHGIESVEQRLSQNKLAEGVITLSAEATRGEVKITVSDDGAGIQLDQLRQKAKQLGLISPRQSVSDEELLSYAFRSGLSTAKEVTELAGRGVGLDVVDRELRKLGGAISVNTVANSGTSFVLRMPQSLAINEALLVQVTGRSFAIPVNALIGVVHLPAEQIQTLNEQLKRRAELEYAGERYGYLTLARLLRLPSSVDKSSTEAVPVLLLRCNDQPIALAVDGMLGRREIVVKSAGPQLQQVPGYIGAAIMADGRVVLVLDIGQLWEHYATHRLDAAEALNLSAPVDGRSTVMVVDDSITIRKFTSRMLERHGYKVLVARDGIEALALIRQQRPELVLMDLEMPRMDGFELLSIIRGEASLASTPVIVISSRTGGKHRQRIMHLGVSHYLGKPYQEAELVSHIERVLRKEGQEREYATQ